MKRYIIWIGIVYMVLLLLPLPVLGKLNPDIKPPITSSNSTNKSSDKINEKNEESFRLLDTDTNIVYEVSVKDFVTGSVGAEMYPTYNTEALKAQAVASYTYYSVLKKRQKANPNTELRGADFADMVSGFPIFYTDNQLKKRWGKNYNTYYKKISNAVNSVLGKMITYDGEPITAVYHAISSGTTEDAAVMWGTSYPYLQPVVSPGDKLSPSYQSSVTFKPDKFKSDLSKIKNLTFSGTADKWLDKNIQTSSSGTVTQLKICNTSLTGSQIREALGLRSANFTVEYREGGFHFTVYGYGHNVGMSQYGADYLARQGLSYEEILHYYYTDVEIKG